MAKRKLSEADLEVSALRSANDLLSVAEEQHGREITRAENAQAKHWNANRIKTDEARATVNRISGLAVIGPWNNTKLEEAKALLERLNTEGERLHDKIWETSSASLQRIKAIRDEMRDRLLLKGTEDKLKRLQERLGGFVDGSREIRRQISELKEEAAHHQTESPSEDSPS